jgi:hypothetical protein
MKKSTAALVFLALAPHAGGQTPFNNISSGTNTSAAMTVGSGASLTTANSGTINANFTNNGTGAQLTAVATRLQTSG